MRLAKHLSPRRRSIPVVATIVAFGCFVVPLISATPSLAQPPCVVADNGSGTADLPPGGCGYSNPSDVFKVINGLAPGDELHWAAIIDGFSSIVRTPGGPLGGEVQQFLAVMSGNLTGTGSLSAMNRACLMQVTCETHSAPRILAQPVQSFDTEWFTLQGQLPPGDPDFDLLRITAGNGFGLPSPGHTTLTSLPVNNWNVDSFFDITYRIDFVGHAGGPLGGRSGSTTGTIRMQAGQPVAPTRATASTWGQVKMIYR